MRYVAGGSLFFAGYKIENGAVSVNIFLLCRVKCFVGRCYVFCCKVYMGIKGYKKQGKRYKKCLFIPCCYATVAVALLTSGEKKCV